MEIKLSEEEIQWIRDTVESIDGDGTAADWQEDTVELVKLIDTKIRFPKDDRSLK